MIVYTGTIYSSSYTILMLYVNLSRTGELRAVQYGEQAARNSFSAPAEAHCALLSASFGAPTVSICTVYWVYLKCIRAYVLEYMFISYMRRYC